MAKKLNADATAAHKALFIYSLLLFSGRRYFLADLAEKCQCAKPTVLRLIRAIEESGVAPILTGIEHGKRWFQLAELSGTPHIALSHDEVERLALCRDLIEHILPDGMARIVTSSLAKLSVLLKPAEQRARATAPKGGSMVKGRIDYTPFQSYIDAILKAIPTKTVCAVTYAAPLKEPRVFEVVPVRLTADGEALHLDGWRVSSKGTPVIRFPITLAVHRMHECLPTRRALEECPELPEPAGEFGLIGDEPFLVRAAFDVQYAMHIKERQWSTGQSLADLPDGGVELEFIATSEEQVITWILGLGNGAELLEPKELRGRLRETIAALADIYAEDGPEESP